MITRWISATALWATLMAGLVPVPVSAAESDLLSACWPAASLPVKPGERLIRRGAPGHNQSIPAVSLPAAGSVPAELKGAIRRVDLPKGRKLVALTLDMCEQPGEIAGYDGQIIDYLRSQRVKATIFAGGKWMMTHGERSRQLIADGLFEIGNHGWVHRNVRGLSGRGLLDEIRGPIAAYAAQRAELAGQQCAARFQNRIGALPERLQLYRFPFGACNPAALATVAAEGMLAIQWDVSSGDATPSASGAAVAEEMVRNVRPGSIILAHANGRGYHTGEALPIAVPKLKAMGYTFVTVSELLAAGKPVVTETCWDHRPGDTDKYDAFFTRPPEARRAATSKTEPADGTANRSSLPR